MNCFYCGWSGSSGDRVAATPQWVHDHDVDPDHFLNNGLNCPDCGEAQWTFDDDEFDGFEDVD
jgi:hypothetical protein